MFTIDVESLISLIEPQRTIYDPQDPWYKDTRRKKAIWEDIAKVLIPDSERMNESKKKNAVKYIKKRWRSMRDGFARELKAQKEESHSGSGISRRHVYVHFLSLQFLRPVVELQQTETSLDEVPSPYSE